MSKHKARVRSSVTRSVATLDASLVRDEFADTLNRVAFGANRVVLRRRGKPLAALIPIEDYHRLELLEREAIDRADLETVAERASDQSQKAIPYELARKSLGLD
jgi:prevent-host-death family protein